MDLLLRRVAVAQVADGKVSVPLRHRLIPALNGVVVVGSRVDHTVLIVVVGQVNALPVGGEGELQHLHPRETGLSHHLKHAGGQEAQILRDDLQLAQLPLNGVKELQPRSLLPVAAGGGVVLRRDGVILVESPEMVHPHHIAQFKAVGHPANPPVVSRLFVVVPAVQGVAPELPGGAEAVRGTARHKVRLPLGVELEQFRMEPAVRAVEGHIDGDIADDADSLPVGVGLEFLPLLLKFQLQEAVEQDILLQLHLQLRHRLRLSEADLILPLRPALPLEMILHRHVDAVLLRLRAEILGGFAPARLPAGKRLSQNLIAGLVDPLIVHVAGILPAVRLQALRLGQQLLLRQGIQVYEIGISRKGAKGLVRGIPVACGAEGQHLPILLSCLPQPVHKVIGRL